MSPDFENESNTVEHGKIDDLMVQVAAFVNKIWKQMLEDVINQNQTVQIALMVFLVTLIIATCLYKRQKLAKSTIQTLQRCGDTFEADR